ncbi:aspartate carbamoyltransferase catalytic subunit [Sclerotinia borealis F-4128]|uniref:Pyrimidine-specific carbamoyl phosphate synthase-aspartate carbamoyl transferase n=1 Tax=Sclerotinia borealis (strain F-4128) TaxID=1432307 RepID=W9CJ66_SCLBF|nr:aspartate carbamoyltransferase catalytic subunit [Sclerotinia borealis F-4128]
MAELVFPPVAAPILNGTDEGLISLELKDGTVYQGYSFGAKKSVAGELVFQTGMVGYPESITDPSYRGQILVITFPLVGNYGVPSRETMDELLKDLPAHFEASEIHIAGLICASYAGEEFSHYLATSSLGTWLKEQGVPAIYGVDTRALTKRIREEGSMLGRMLLQKDTLTNGNSNDNFSTLSSKDWRSSFEEIDWVDPNTKNLVADVSIREPKLYKPDPSNALKHPSGRPIRVLCLDVGLKYNQLRCLVKRGVEVLICPWDYDFPALAGKDYDGLFISNGPGDPAMMDETVKHIQTAMKENRTPIFGICLGHQLLARAAGAQTEKMKFGNRGHNIPCTNMLTGKCHITSQNHGFAVQTSSLPTEWKELFVNANDGSNEGIRHVNRPYFSVQFHPESTPGPKDTEFLFDVFINTIVKTLDDEKLLSAPVVFPGGEITENEKLTPKVNVKKVLILGSGGLSIGQAGEFDYSGSQAIKALKEEGIYTILINPNIATIQTSKGLADKVYFLPVTADFVRKVIVHENPDAIYVTFGGQTALSVGIQLKDEFEGLGVKVLGTPISTIITTEDRELFARSMESIGEKCAKSASANTIDEAMHVVKDIGYPVIVRAAYALGGLGSGFADNDEELLELCNKAFAASPQVLIERSMKGWKEIEYEVVRDCRDNCITVCNMENFDPLGIHTGDSIVVAPSQTLSDDDYNMLRTTAVNVIRHLGVVGECNIQYALNPDSKEYCIIEVNARLSRSSALASKATGYPLAFIAAKLGLNIPLNEIKNSVTQKTCACFEPSLDYVVVKMPRWDLKKFTRVSTQLGSSMKSVGEVMSIGRTFEEAIQKAIRAIDFHNLGFSATKALMSIDDELQTPSDQRLFAIANAMQSGYSVNKIWEMTKIDKWFLNKLKGLNNFSKHMSTFNTSTISINQLRQAKQLGFCDRQLAKLWDSTELAVRLMRTEAGIIPVVKQIDTVAAEFEAHTNYLYMTYNGSENDISFNDHGVMVLGSGVYRIGSSVEFDWCSVRAIRTLRESGFKTVMVNYNPETVSTDYDEADRLYFENINLETILDIYQLESSSGVLIAMGGQTPNNIALPLHRQNVKILGTSPEMIDTAENRFKFSRMLDSIHVDQPTWKELTSFEDAKIFCNKVSYPVLVRPSYVLSGAAMNTVYSEPDLEAYLAQAVDVSRDHPVVITKYIENAKEIDMDAVAKDGVMVGHFISEHVENAGVHSGDATLVLPPQDLDSTTIQRIEEATRLIGKALNITGPYNIQFIAKDNDIKVIECNVRASRSTPFVSKVMGVDLIEMATRAIMGVPFIPYPPTNLPAGVVGVKVPQFSFSRLSGADPVLGVEMASTGEVACFGRDKYEAYLKALISTGFKLPNRNILLSIGSYKDKKEMLPSVVKLQRMGYKLFATAGTADFLQEHEVPVQYLEILGKGEDDQKSEYSLTQHLANSMIDLYINLPSSNRYRRPATYMSKGYQTRRMAVDYQIPLVTNVKNAKILIEAIARHYDMEICGFDAQTSLDDSSTENGINGEDVPSELVEFNNNSPFGSPAMGTRPDSSHLTKFSAFGSTPSSAMRPATRSRFLDGAANQAPHLRSSAPEYLGSPLYPQPTISPSLQFLLGQSPFKNQHVLSVNQYSRQDLHLLFAVAQEMRLGVQREGVLSILKGRLLTTLFYEPSTRTSASFDAAMQRLGGRTVAIATSHSSTVKGESLADTIRTLGCYGDAIVLRHPEESSAAIAAKFSPVPIINGGNGSKEHPTQAFLDLFTIREELGTVGGLTITFTGDLRYGRTVHSLVKLLQHYDVHIQLVSPQALSLPQDILALIKSKPGQLLSVSTELTPDIIARSDVLYCTRVQKERFADLEEYESLKNSFIIDNKTMRNAKSSMIVMHPLPRNAEISEEVDFDQRAAYFRQMRYGLYCRMALLALVLSP